jgi:hypothetical protein
LSELKAVLQELQQEGEKIKQKEDEIKKKEKVCMWILFICSLTTFLAYFPEMKVGLSNNQSVCLCVSLSPTNNFLTAW